MFFFIPANSAAEFTTSSTRASTNIQSILVVKEEAQDAAVYPTINKWTANPDAFCAGLPGAIVPLSEFDPMNFTVNLPAQESKHFYKAEVTHGCLVMLATIRYMMADNFHLLFNGDISGLKISHLAQVQSEAPFSFVFWESPLLLLGWVDCCTDGSPHWRQQERMRS